MNDLPPVLLVCFWILPAIQLGPLLGMLLLPMLRPLWHLLRHLAHLLHLGRRIGQPRATALHPKLKGSLPLLSAQNGDWPPVHAGRPLQLARVSQ